MQILKGKPVAENLAKDFEDRIQNLKKQEIIPHIAILGIGKDKAREIYIKKVEKNCNKYGIEFTLKIADTAQEFRKNFENIKNDKNITGVMFQQPMPKELFKFINETPCKKDIEGVSFQNMGKLFCGECEGLIPCTGRAIIEIIDYYNIDVTGKNITVVGRSNIVGKAVLMQLIAKSATVTVCHSKTKNLMEKTTKADIVIMAIGKPNFLKKEFIKNDAILIDVGTNFENDKLVGDIDFEDVKEKALMCSPVPGGVGTVTNTVLIDNIIKSCEMD